MCIRDSVEAEQSVLDSRRVLEAQVQKLETQLSSSEARVLSLEKDMAEQAVARLEALPETAGAAQAAHQDRLAAAALRAEAAADRALAQQARSDAAAARSDMAVARSDAAAVPEAPARKLLEPRGYDFVEAAAAPENAEAALPENAPTLALGAAWAQTTRDARAARDDRAAAAAQREAADRDRAAAARDRSEAAKELAAVRCRRPNHGY